MIGFCRLPQLNSVNSSSKICCLFVHGDGQWLIAAEDETLLVHNGLKTLKSGSVDCHFDIFGMFT